LTTSYEIQLDDLPEAIRTYHRKDGPLNVDDAEQMITLEELEQRYIAHVLRVVAGNKTQAAHVLRMDRKTLYRKLRRWSIAQAARADAATTVSSPASLAGEESHG